MTESKQIQLTMGPNGQINSTLPVGKWTVKLLTTMTGLSLVSKNEFTVNVPKNGMAVVTLRLTPIINIPLSSVKPPTTRKPSSRKTTTTTRVRATNLIYAETCAPGKKYNNPKNCCCAQEARKNDFAR
jgi:hypothetical protein